VGRRKHRVVIAIAACGLSLGALPEVPTAGADPTVTLPAMTPTNSGPIIGGGSASAQMSQQLKSLGNPDIQEVDGSDAAQFITAAAAITNRDLASPFMALQRALTCQTNNAGFGARAYRRKDGMWGGAMLVVIKSTIPDAAALAACEHSNWRKPSAGSTMSMCDSGWSYPPQTFNNRGGETYYVMLAGTDSDFCSTLNDNYRGKASPWP
jgi:hypothetical protein